MKIAFIVDAFPVISETFILNQVTGLTGLGHDVSIFAGARQSPDQVSGVPGTLDAAGRIYYHNEMPRNILLRSCKAFPLFLRYFRKAPLVVLRSLDPFRYGMEALSLNLFYKTALFLEKGRFDIIHCQFGTNGNLGALLKEVGIEGKLVTTFHGYDIRLGIKEGGDIYKRLFRVGDLFLSISDYNYRHLVDLGLDPRKIKYHPVGIDTSRFRFVRRSPSDTVNILTVARLVGEKGLAYAIKAVDMLIRDHGIRNLRYRIVGDGPEADSLKALVRGLGLEDKVIFEGALGNEEVVERYKEADLYLLSSVAEALPVTLMEAQASGLPVVSTDVGSVREIVEEGKSGLLAPPRDEKALAAGLKHLIDAPELWQRMGEAGRKAVEEKYDIAKLNVALVGIYKDLLEK